MSKILVTETLGQKLKKLRMEYNVKANKIAEAIGKSQAYISKLEKGQAARLEMSAFIEILKNIVGDNSDDVNNAIISLLGTETLEYSDDEIENILWMQNFDTVERKIPISEDLINYIETELEKTNLSVLELVKYVNQNNDLLTEKFNNLDSFPKNFWFINENTSHSAIIMELNYTDIDEIMNRKKMHTNYITMQSLIYNLLRYQNIPMGEAQVKTINILNDFKFLSIAERNRIIDNSKSDNEIESRLPALDIANSKLIHKIEGHLFFISQKYMSESKDVLSNIVKNFDADDLFSLAFCGIDLTPLGHLSQPQKKDFRKQVISLVEEYSKKENENTNSLSELL